MQWAVTIIVNELITVALLIWYANLIPSRRGYVPGNEASLRHGYILMYT